METWRVGVLASPSLHFSSTPFLRLCPCKEAFGFLEKALADRTFLAIAKLGEFPELGLLGRSETGRHLHVDADMQIAVAITLDVFDTLAFQAHHRAGLCAGLDPDIRLAIQCGN